MLFNKLGADLLLNAPHEKSHDILNDYKLFDLYHRLNDFLRQVQGGGPPGRIIYAAG